MCARSVLDADDLCIVPIDPPIVGALVALAREVLRDIVVRSPVTASTFDEDDGSAMHEIVVRGNITVRSPTALFRWQRRPVAPAAIRVEELDDVACLAELRLFGAKPFTARRSVA